MSCPDHRRGGEHDPGGLDRAERRARRRQRHLAGRGRAPAGRPAQFPVPGAGHVHQLQRPGAGKSYSRTEAVNLPLHISGLYNVEVITNYDGELFENGATANNTGIASQPMTVTVMPRPDLQVAAIDVPSHGQRRRLRSRSPTPSINQGSAPTTNNWDDKVYLSLTPYVADDSILIQDLPNQSALEPGDEYQATTVPVVVPERYAGQVYVIVDVDANHQVDQWPNGTHDLEYQPIYVNPIPLPDLVLSNVVAPDPGNRRQHVQRQLHGHEPGRRARPW